MLASVRRSKRHRVGDGSEVPTTLPVVEGRSGSLDRLDLDGAQLVDDGLHGTFRRRHHDEHRIARS